MSTLTKGLIAWALCAVGIVAYAMWLLDARQWWEYLIAGFIVLLSFPATTYLFRWALK